jgi:hypothetical protein
MRLQFNPSLLSLPHAPHASSVQAIPALTRMAPMLYTVPFDVLQHVPWSMVIDKLMLDFDIFDLVLWFPKLSWGEIIKAFGALALCKCVSDQIENWLLAPVKARLKQPLQRWLAARSPRLARRMGF